MVKIPRDELNLAKHMVLWFADGGGEVDVEHLAELHGVELGTLESWADEKGYLFDDGKGINLEVLPALWNEFAPKSRVCLALHTALQEVKTDNRVVQWLQYCDERVCQ